MHLCTGVSWHSGCDSSALKGDYPKVLRWICGYVDIHGENDGTLGMVPLIINPIYTLYSGYLLGDMWIFMSESFIWIFFGKRDVKGLYLGDPIDDGKISWKQFYSYHIFNNLSQGFHFQVPQGSILMLYYINPCFHRFHFPKNSGESAGTSGESAGTRLVTLISRASPRRTNHGMLSGKIPATGASAKSFLKGGCLNRGSDGHHSITRKIHVNPFRYILFVLCGLNQVPPWGSKMSMLSLPKWIYN